MKIRSTDRLWNLLSNLLMNSLALKKEKKVKEWGLIWNFWTLEAKDCALLSSRDADLLEPTESLQGNPSYSSV